MYRMENLTHARSILAFVRKRDTFNRVIAADDEFSLTFEPSSTFLLGMRRRVEATLPQCGVVTSVRALETWWCYNIGTPGVLSCTNRRIPSMTERGRLFAKPSAPINATRTPPTRVLHLVWNVYNPSFWECLPRG